MPSKQSGACCLKNIIGLCVLGGIGVLLWYFLGKPSASQIKHDLGSLGNFTNVLGNLNNLTQYIQGFNNDPFLSNNSTSSWDNGYSNAGLSLTILNALDDKWFPFFIKAVTQWDDGNPDCLTLFPKNVSVDHSCSRVDGNLKVCNNNFGQTGWLGINELITTTTTNIIQSSVAKMNEYYLQNADQYQKQYTMCHEMGHGFGLPHTDENFYNKDLGNCLDYTIHPEVNMQPAKMNFNRLKTLYGVVPGTNSGSSSNSSSSGNSSTGGRRIETGFVSNVQIPGRLTPEEELEYEMAINELEFDVVPHRRLESASGWRLLSAHSHGFGSRYARRLGTDYTIHVIVMHPVDHEM